MTDFPSTERLQLPSADAATGAYAGEVDLDLGNLLACASRGPNAEALAADATAACLSHGRDVVQRLVNALFGLPAAADQGSVLGRVVSLPPPSTRLPRGKPLPTPRPPTRWEAYAKEKGIVKRKRSGRIWDEASGEWTARHGARRAARTDDAILAAKPWEEEGAGDPFAAAAAERRARTAAQGGRRAANVAAAARQGHASAGVALSAALPLAGRAPGAPPPAPLGARLGRDGVKRAAALARVSTASLGKFDRPVEGEKPPGKGTRSGLPGKRRTFLPVAQGEAERAAVRAALGALERRDGLKSKLNAGRAVNAL